MYARAGWIAAFDMHYVMFEHGVTYARVGSADNVWTRHGHNECLGAQARSRVHMAD